MKKTEALFAFFCFLMFFAVYTTPVESASIPSEVLSPVAGDLEVVSSLEQCLGTKWCFNQHQSVGHGPGGGICQADDTYAWDANLNTPIFDSDEGKPVYAVEQGVASQTYGDCINAGGSYGQLLIEHDFQGNVWWSGYLHLRDIQVTLGQSVDKNTLLGYISNTSPDPIANHLHFVVYKGQNNRGGLVSFDVNIVPRNLSSKFNPGDFVYTTVNLNMREGPGTGYAEVPLPDGYIPKGSKIQIIDNEDNGVFATGYYWWYVDFEGYNGWCAEAWLEKAIPPEIIVEDADDIWEMAMEPPPSGLIDAASGVTPRMIIEYADSVYLSVFNTPPSELLTAASKVTPRIELEYADSVYYSDLKTPPPELIRAANRVGPRIIVEYADSNFFMALVRPDFVPSPLETVIGDVSGDDSVSAYDAALILQFVVGLIDKFPVQSMPSPSDSAMRHYTLSVPEQLAKASSSIQVPVFINDVTELVAGGISLKYSPTVLKAVDVFPTTKLNGSYWKSNTKLDGEVRFAFASTQPAEGKGRLLIIEFEVLPQTEGQKSHLILDNVNLSNSLTITKKNGSVTVLPSETFLLQNYPNPFNPETWIPFALSQDAIVTINIYDITGNLVRKLELDNKPAGFYTNRDQAAYWNGRNKVGERASSGVYFYTIKAGNFIATRRMAIMK